MSPRAAGRLEQIEFTEVYDYVAGIADWKAAGLSVDGDAPVVQRVFDATRPDVPTCAVDDLVGAVRTRTFDAEWDECIVLTDDGVVVGRLRDRAWKADDAATVAEVMEPGPTTVRPDGLLQDLVDRMSKRSTKLVVVTTPQGFLVGVLVREEAERLLTGERPELIWRDCEGCPGRWALAPLSPGAPG
jgi:hypothetical protein